MKINVLSRSFRHTRDEVVLPAYAGRSQSAHSHVSPCYYRFQSFPIRLTETAIYKEIITNYMNIVVQIKDITSGELLCNFVNICILFS